VYPAIKETEQAELKFLYDGYEAMLRAFPPPRFRLAVVHGQMKSADRDIEMQRFVQGTANLLVATTVIEVGVNVPNASVMVIENAERFGLAQLHQLRGRVGRGAEQSFCILMTAVKLSRDSKKRMDTMVRTNDGFEIAEVDLELRGPGDIEGTQQSGVLGLRLADIAKDVVILQHARAAAGDLLERDPKLESDENQALVQEMNREKTSSTNWSKIS